MGIEKGGVNNIWVGEFKRSEISIEGVANEDGTWGQNVENTNLDVGESGRDRIKLFFGHAGVSEKELSTNNTYFSI